jgi:hypothetical protein
MNDSVEVIYIAGYVRSGSTILDIILGNIPGCFSTGELVFLTTNGLRDNEFCSCFHRVEDCIFWKAVAEEWGMQRELPLEKYNEILYSHFRNKKSLSLFKKLLFPDGIFQQFLNDTKSLYILISTLSGNKTIIESSKSPYRILLLRKIGLKVKVVHLVRRLNDVLTATRKTLLANPELGIEKNIMPRNKWNVLVTWSLSNLYTKFFAIGMPKAKVRYEELIADPATIIREITDVPLSFIDKLDNRGPFAPEHVVAGNRLRMQQSFFIIKPSVHSAEGKGSTSMKYLTRFLNWIFW